MFGDSGSIDDSMISTSLIERENLNLRQENKRLARKTLAYSKDDDWLQYHVSFQMAAHNFTRPHIGL